MKGKNSFTAYCDWIDIFEELSDDEAGKLIKHIMRYVNDQAPEAPDKLTKIAFAPIKSTLKRDLEKWISKVETLKSNGSKGGRPKKQLKANGNQKKQLVLEKAVSDSVSVNDSESDSIEKAFTNYNLLAEKTGIPKAIKLTKQRKQKIKRTLKDYSLEEWNKALRKVMQSDFCTGKSSDFKANLDFMLQEKSFIKIIEGAYDNNTSQKKKSNEPQINYIPHPDE